MIKLVFINTDNNILKTYFSENVPTIGHFVSMPIDKKERAEMKFRVKEVHWILKRVEVYIYVEEVI